MIAPAIKIIWPVATASVKQNIIPAIQRKNSRNASGTCFGFGYLSRLTLVFHNIKMIKSECRKDIINPDYFSFFRKFYEILPQIEVLFLIRSMAIYKLLLLITKNTLLTINQSDNCLYLRCSGPLLPFRFVVTKCRESFLSLYNKIEVVFGLYINT